MKVGFIGLGTMGRPMAKRLASAGHELLVWNRTRPRPDALPAGTVLVGNPTEACQAELVITAVSDDAAVESVIFDAHGRLVSSGVPGLIHVCMSSIGDGLARRLAEEHARVGQVYVSAPMFGPPEAAQSGRLVIPVAGPRAAVERARLVLAVLGRVDVLSEDPAAANIVKSAGNFLMASVVESLRDTTALVHAAGVDPREFTGIITQALFPTPVYQYLGGLLANRESQRGVRVPNPFLKGAEQCAEAARRLGVAVPLIDHVGKR